MNEIRIKVNYEKGTIQRKGINLRSGDYNSTKIVFEFDKEYSSRKVFELANPEGEAIFIKEIPSTNEIVLVGYADVKDVNGYIKYEDASDNVYWYDEENEQLYDRDYEESVISIDTLTKVQQEASLFETEGTYTFEISLYDGRSRLTSVRGNLIITEESVRVGDEVVTAYIPVFDQLMNESITLINNLQGAIQAEQTRQTNEQTRVSNENTRNSNENTRNSNETARVNAETSRASAETTRQTNETARQTAETARATAEDNRATAEQIRSNNFQTLKTQTEDLIGDLSEEASRRNNEEARISNETLRQSNETSRETAETSRSTAETARGEAETSRQTNETARESAETSRATAETVRTNAENARVTNENTRNSNETTRQTNETTRQAQEGARQESETARSSAETLRNTAETSRASEETTRVENETTRVSNENTRISNETTRIANETARQGKYNKIESFLQPATATGASIHTEDSADWYGKLNFEGFSRQETTTGKQLFNKNDLTGSNCTIEYSNGLYNVTKTGSSPKITSNISLPAGDYTINSVGNLGTIIFYNGSTTVKSISDNHRYYNFTLDSEVNNVRFWFNGDSYSFDFDSLIIASGTYTSETMPTWEKYTGGIPQPNINYPSETRNLTGDVEIKHYSRNMFDKNTATYKEGYLKNADGVEQTTTASGYLTSYIKVKPNTQYTIQGSVRTPDNNTSYGIYFYDSSKNWISKLSSLQTVPYTFTTPANCYYIQFQYITATYNANDIQIEEGSTATEYMPYGKNITFPLGTEKMYAGSKPTDNGIKHIRKQIIFDGTEEGWGKSGAGTENFYYRFRYLSHYKVSTTYICNRFCRASISASNTEEGMYITADGELRIRFGEEMSTADFKTWLGTNPITVEYDLDEPETVPYTQAKQEAYNELQNIETYQYVNNIDLIANEETNMTLNYKKDIQMQIAEEDARLNSLESRVALLE